MRFKICFLLFFSCLLSSVIVGQGSPPPPPPPPPPALPVPIPADGVFKLVDEKPRIYRESCEELSTLTEREACAHHAMLELIYSNLQYPTIAREQGIEGSCVVTFIVDLDGSLMDIRLVHDIGGGCGAAAVEAVRFLEAPETWVQGIKEGRVVKTRYNLPVSFKLQKVRNLTQKKQDNR